MPLQAVAAHDDLNICNSPAIDKFIICLHNSLWLDWQQLAAMQADTLIYPWLYRCWVNFNIQNRILHISVNFVEVDTNSVIFSSFWH